MKTFAEMSDPEMGQTIREALMKVANGDVKVAKEIAEELSNLGGIPNHHSKELIIQMNPRTMMEWYVGQYVSMVENAEWRTMGHFLSDMYNFTVPAPEVNPGRGPDCN